MYKGTMYNVQSNQAGRDVRLFALLRNLNNWQLLSECLLVLRLCSDCTFVRCFSEDGPVMVRWMKHKTITGPCPGNDLTKFEGHPENRHIELKIFFKNSPTDRHATGISSRVCAVPPPLFLKVVATTCGGGGAGLSFLLFFWFFSFSFFFLSGENSYPAQI